MSKMGDLSLDVPDANKFISRLSKSLLAICQECVDFEAGIEIMGYINVKIDSGSNSVDYVLKEKVQKSTDTSMDFLSNSFLAKQDKNLKQQDGVCSSIPESQQQSFLFASHSASYKHDSHNPNDQSKVLRAAHKRQRNVRDINRKASQCKYPRKCQTVSRDHSYSSSSSSIKPPEVPHYVHLPVAIQTSEYDINQTDVKDKQDVNCDNDRDSDPQDNDGNSQAKELKLDPENAPVSDCECEIECAESEDDDFQQLSGENSLQLIPGVSGLNVQNSLKSVDLTNNISNVSESVRSGHDQSVGSTLDVNSETTGSFGEFLRDILYPPSSFCGQGENSEDAANLEPIEIGDRKEMQLYEIIVSSFILLSEPFTIFILYQSSCVPLLTLNRPMTD